MYENKNNKIESVITIDVIGVPDGNIPVRKLSREKQTGTYTNRHHNFLPGSNRFIIELSAEPKNSSKKSNLSIQVEDDTSDYSIPSTKRFMIPVREENSQTDSNDLQRDKPSPRRRSNENSAVSPIQPSITSSTSKLLSPDRRPLTSLQIYHQTTPVNNKKVSPKRKSDEYGKISPKKQSPSSKKLSPKNRVSPKQSSNEFINISPKEQSTLSKILSAESRSLTAPCVHFPVPKLNPFSDSNKIEKKTSSPKRRLNELVTISPKRQLISSNSSSPESRPLTVPGGVYQNIPVPKRNLHNDSNQGANKNLSPKRSSFEFTNISPKRQSTSSKFLSAESRPLTTPSVYQNIPVPRRNLPPKPNKFINISPKRHATNSSSSKTLSSEILCVYQNFQPNRTISQIDDCPVEYLELNDFVSSSNQSESLSVSASETPSDEQQKSVEFMNKLSSVSPKNVQVPLSPKKLLDTVVGGCDGYHSDINHAETKKISPKRSSNDLINISAKKQLTLTTLLSPESRPLIAPCVYQNIPVPRRNLQSDFNHAVNNKISPKRKSNESNNISPKKQSTSLKKLSPESRTITAPCVYQNIPVPKRNLHTDSNQGAIKNLSPKRSASESTNISPKRQSTSSKLLSPESRPLTAPCVYQNIPVPRRNLPPKPNKFINISPKRHATNSSSSKTLSSEILCVYQNFQPNRTISQTDDCPVEYLELNDFVSSSNQSESLSVSASETPSDEQQNSVEFMSKLSSVSPKNVQVPLSPKKLLETVVGGCDGYHSDINHAETKKISPKRSSNDLINISAKKQLTLTTLLSPESRPLIAPCVYQNIPVPRRNLQSDFNHAVNNKISPKRKSNESNNISPKKQSISLKKLSPESRPITAPCVYQNIPVPKRNLHTDSNQDAIKNLSPKRSASESTNISPKRQSTSSKLLSPESRPLTAPYVYQNIPVPRRNLPPKPNKFINISPKRHATNSSSSKTLSSEILCVYQNFQPNRTISQTDDCPVEYLELNDFVSSSNQSESLSVSASETPSDEQQKSVEFMSKLSSVSPKNVQVPLPQKKLLDTVVGGCGGYHNLIPIQLGFRDKIKLPPKSIDHKLKYVEIGSVDNSKINPTSKPPLKPRSRLLTYHGEDELIENSSPKEIHRSTSFHIDRIQERISMESSTQETTHSEINTSPKISTLDAKSSQSSPLKKLTKSLSSFAIKMIPNFKYNRAQNVRAQQTFVKVNPNELLKSNSKQQNDELEQSKQDEVKEKRQQNPENENERSNLLRSEQESKSCDTGSPQVTNMIPAHERNSQTNNSELGSLNISSIPSSYKTLPPERRPNTLPCAYQNIQPNRIRIISQTSNLLPKKPYVTRSKSLPTSYNESSETANIGSHKNQMDYECIKHEEQTLTSVINRLYETLTFNIGSTEKLTASTQLTAEQINDSDFDVSPTMPAPRVKHSEILPTSIHQTFSYDQSNNHGENEVVEKSSPKETYCRPSFHIGSTEELIASTQVTAEQINDSDFDISPTMPAPRVKHSEILSTSIHQTFSYDQSNNHGENEVVEKSSPKETYCRPSFHIGSTEELIASTQVTAEQINDSDFDISPTMPAPRVKHSQSSVTSFKQISRSLSSLTIKMRPNFTIRRPKSTDKQQNDQCEAENEKHHQIPDNADDQLQLRREQEKPENQQLSVIPLHNEADISKLTPKQRSNEYENISSIIPSLSNILPPEKRQITSPCVYQNLQPYRIRPKRQIDRPVSNLLPKKSCIKPSQSYSISTVGHHTQLHQADCESAKGVEQPFTSEVKRSNNTLISTAINQTSSDDRPVEVELRSKLSTKPETSSTWNSNADIQSNVQAGSSTVRISDTSVTDGYGAYQKLLTKRVSFTDEIYDIPRPRLITYHGDLEGEYFPVEYRCSSYLDESEEELSADEVFVDDKVETTKGSPSELKILSKKTDSTIKQHKLKGESSGVMIRRSSCSADNNEYLQVDGIIAHQKLQRLRNSASNLNVSHRMTGSDCINVDNSP